MSTTRRIVRATWGVFVACLLLVSFSSVARSSDQDPVYRIAKFSLHLPANASPTALRPNVSLIFDSDARRAYQIIKLNGTDDVMLRSWNLETRTVQLQSIVPASIIQHGPVSSNGNSSSEWIHSLDPKSGILYLPYNTTQGDQLGGVLAINTKTLAVVHNFARLAVNGADPNQLNCASQGSASCLPQTPMVSPTIRGLSFVPAVLTGLQPKLLLLMHEAGAPNAEGNMGIVWVAQWDAQTGHQDWIYRVQACQQGKLFVSPLGQYQVAIFEARLGSGIYLACWAAGRTGQVVRLTVDSLNTPQAEQAYPGPLQAVDAISDEEADRLLIKAENGSGESWWVFDGRSASYAGVIGINSSEVNTATGIDRLSGRLYVSSPPTGDASQSNPGGLMYSDTRRNPAPQPLQLPQYAQANTGQIGIDTNPVTFERQVWVPTGDDRYDIFHDGAPITDDPSLSDLDQLTTDVEEKPGVTGRTFTGGAHAYGLQLRIAGGLNGVPPTGPDSSGIRVGRSVPEWINSPCGYADRQLVLGAVDQAGLSNNLASATATVGEADPGSKTDAEQPEERCYPRPKIPEGHPGQFIDVWNNLRFQIQRYGHQDTGEYPRPLDKDVDDNGKSEVDDYAGAAWPFRSAQCSGDGKANTPTTVKPLDRGGDGSVVPANVREQSVTPEQYVADVTCAQATSEVNASAGGAALNVPNVAGIGTITVGDVSSSVRIYLDKEKGLVTETISRANKISIGDLVEIDQAYTIAQSWAAGRSGTAGTSFERRLCGVRVKDPTPDVNPNTPAVNANTSDPTKSSVEPSTGTQVKQAPPVPVYSHGYYYFQGCGDPNQATLGQQPVIDNINKALGARGRASAPQPDGPLSQGTPGGYLASIEKDRLQQVSARAVQNDPTTEVPALELVIFNDDPSEGRGRQIYQFAGVDASSTYGIYLLNPDEFVDPGTVPPDIAPVDDYVPPTYTPPTDSGTGAPPPSGGPIAILYAGVSFLLRRPLDALLAAAVWLILFAPVQLATRRRALRALSAATSGTAVSGAR
jgi:hypothetical protein